MFCVCLGDVTEKSLFPVFVIVSIALVVGGVRAVVCVFMF